jgi:hypothetical protein
MFNKIRLPPYHVENVVTTLSETMQWGLPLLNVPSTWKITRGAGIRIAVIDTCGISDHSDLAGAFIVDECRNFLSRENTLKDLVNYWLKE